MIILSAIRTVKGQVLFPPKVVYKWKNDYEFGFDIGNPDEWRMFLSKFKLDNGNYLPRVSSEGAPIAYRVFVWGSLPNLPRDKTTGRTLFPMQKPMMLHGQLLPLRRPSGSQRPGS